MSFWLIFENFVTVLSKLNTIFGSGPNKFDFLLSFHFEKDNSLSSGRDTTKKCENKIFQSLFIFIQLSKMHGARRINVSSALENHHN